VAESDRGPTVLVIDDEAVVRDVTRRALEPHVSVLEAADGDDGLALLDQPQTNVDLVVTDFVMPRVSGLAVIAVLARYRPELPIIGMTGHAPPVLREVAATFGVRVLEKPFDNRVLVAMVREVLAETRERRRIEAGRRVRAGVRPSPGGLVAAARTLALPVMV
jgi:two-component system cell cycle sensor histidine kinase/response regulator CckA